jgi:hypothetical protein
MTPKQPLYKQDTQAFNILAPSHMSVCDPLHHLSFVADDVSDEEDLEILNYDH